MSGSSFRQGSQGLDHLSHLDVSAKQVERVVRRIGEERCDQRDAEVEAFERLPLVDKDKAPKGITPPDLAVVMVDGGRLQILDRSGSTADSGEKGEEQEEPTVREPGSKGKHWREGKVGLLMRMSSPSSKADPCPDIPQHFIDEARIEKLAREMKAKPRRVEAASPSQQDDGPVESIPTTDPEAEPTATPAATAADAPVSPCAEEGKTPSSREEGSSWDPPEVKARKVVASRRNWKKFGPILATAAWSVGYMAAPRRAFVGDGSTHVWGVWRRHFTRFEPILDFVHALTYVYGGAMAGRQDQGEGWKVYQRWIGWVWQGKVGKVIEELRKRQQEIGEVEEGDKEGSPRKVVQETLTYLGNQQGRMKYHEYRQKGLPVSSSHIESEIKRMNQRVKGTEKFWSEKGAEGILQLRADYLSDDKPMDTFWKNRQSEETGQRRYRKRT